MAELLKQLCGRINAHYPDARLELHLFNSGNAMLHILIKDELYVLEYVEAEGFGVTRVTDENGWMRGSDVCFVTLQEAEHYLFARLG